MNKMKRIFCIGIKALILSRYVKAISTLLLSLGTMLVISSSVYAASCYVAPNGSDSNSGTLNEPFQSITKAQSVASSGDTVYIRGGTYNSFNISSSDSNYNYVHTISKSGITYEAYNDEKPVFDFSSVTTEKRVAAFYITKGITDVTFRGFEVTGVKVGQQKQSECFRIMGNAKFDRVSAHDNEANGFYFTGDGSGSCVNCDSYNNIGPTSLSKGNTDGFGAHANDVTFSYCRSWNNSDDGYDCISSKGSVTFDHCWAYNMNAGGDSNGFKIGGYARRDPGHPIPVHTVKYCLSAVNGSNGFYANHQPGQAAVWTNNTAYKNRRSDFNMLECASPTDPADIPGTREVLHNNLAFEGTLIRDANLPEENVNNNSWTISGITVTADDFESLDASQMTLPRKPDGSLPGIAFMRPVKGSDVAELGCFTGGYNSIPTNALVNTENESFSLKIGLIIAFIMVIAIMAVLLYWRKLKLRH